MHIWICAAGVQRASAIGWDAALFNIKMWPISLMVIIKLGKHAHQNSPKIQVCYLILFQHLPQKKIIIQEEKVT